MVGVTLFGFILVGIICFGIILVGIILFGFILVGIILFNRFAHSAVRGISVWRLGGLVSVRSGGSGRIS